MLDFFFKSYMTLTIAYLTISYSHLLHLGFSPFSLFSFFSRRKSLITSTTLITHAIPTSISTGIRISCIIPPNSASLSSIINYPQRKKGLNNSPLNCLNDVFNILVSYIRPGRQAHSYLENRL